MTITGKRGDRYHLVPEYRRQTIDALYAFTDCDIPFHQYLCHYRQQACSWVFSDILAIQPTYGESAETELQLRGEELMKSGICRRLKRSLSRRDLPRIEESLHGGSYYAIDKY
jgi:hypothetical protein